MRNFCFAAAFVAFLSGCASVKYNYVPEDIDISEPPIGVISQARVGEQLLVQSKYRLHDDIILREDVKTGALGGFTMFRGEYLKEGEDDKAGYYNPGPSDSPGRVVKCALCDPFKAMMVYHDQPKVCSVTVFTSKVCRAGNVKLERKKVPVRTSDTFQQTLIYSGMVGNKINVGYREFSNNHARPAFNNDVEYDLNASNMIGYKGAQLEIIEATNEYLRYLVVRNFNQATE